MIGGWFPYGPYKRDKSDPFGWRPDDELSPDQKIDEELHRYIDELWQQETYGSSLGG